MINYPAFLSENVKKGTIIFSVKTEACGSPFDTLGQKTDKKLVLSSISKWSSLKIVHIQVDMFDTVVTECEAYLGVKAFPQE